MPWRARLQLCYARDAERTVAHDRHEGPLRVLRRLYPEGPGVCHHVLVHPPGGIVGGDTLEVDVRLDPRSHALITTPGASRFYRSVADPARQQVRATLAAGSRLEWLPLETIAYRDCHAINRMRFDLAPKAEMIGWDLLALGLPAAGEAWSRGRYQQHLELPGVWLEQARIDASDTLLLDGPLGWAGRRVLGTMWFGSGEAIGRERTARLLELARDRLSASPLADSAGVSAVHDRVIVLRALAERVEPLMQLLVAVRAAWRQDGWSLAESAPRIWRT